MAKAPKVGRGPKLRRAQTTRTQAEGGLMTGTMVMELVEGVALRGLIQGPRERSVGMPIGACLYITRELSRALDYAHTAQSAEGGALR